MLQEAWFAAAVGIAVAGVSALIAWFALRWSALSILMVSPIRYRSFKRVDVTDPSYGGDALLARCAAKTRPCS